LARLIACRPVAVGIIEKLIDDLLAEYHAHPERWQKGGPASASPATDDSTAALRRYARLQDVLPNAAALYDDTISELLADYDRAQKGGA